LFIVFIRLTPCFRNKAVSDGAISYHLDHLVKTRVSKVTYGTWEAAIYDPTNSEHLRRSGETHVLPSGRTVLYNHFVAMLPKVSSGGSDLTERG